MVDLGNVIILGDSYSTFEGAIPEGYATWYSPNFKEQTDVRSVGQTWWKILLDSTVSRLLINCSWSGTTVCNTGYNGEDCSERSFIARLDKLISNRYFEENRVDTFIILGGTNDSWAGAPVGEAVYSDWQKQDLYSVLPAFCYLLDRIKSNIPSARVITLVNTGLKEEIAQGFKSICEKYGAEAVELEGIGKANGHPTVLGMSQIAEQLLNYLESTPERKGAVRVIAHRSGPTVYPEQTIMSARKALEDGADMIELDVRFTSDRQLAVCHDDKAERVFGVDKKISDMTAAEFSSLRQKSDPSYGAHLFEDYLRCKAAPLLIHVKQGEVVPALLDMIEKYEYGDKVVIGVTDAALVSEIKGRGIKVLGFMPSPAETQKFADAGADYLRLWECELTEENIARVKDSGKELWVMICGGGLDVGETTKENLERIMNRGFDGILINDVNKLTK